MTAIETNDQAQISLPAAGDVSVSGPNDVRKEMHRFTEKSDLRGAWIVFCQLSITTAIFVVMAVWPGVMTIIIGAILLGGRQLGFFVLTHEAGHRTLFKTQAYNEFVSRWIMSPVDFSNGESYMREHLVHHRAAGTETDPDLTNYVDYPITRARLKRKLKRDLTGQTGFRILKAKYRALLNLQDQNQEDRGALIRGLLVNLSVIGVMVWFDSIWLYGIWLLAQVFVYPAIIRIRQIAEHAAVPDLRSSEARLNTRTTIAGPLMRLLICPHQVNYHIEHHLLASIPIYRLRDAHKRLVELGYYDGIKVPNGYGEVLRDATAKA